VRGDYKVAGVVAVSELTNPVCAGTTTFIVGAYTWDDGPTPRARGPRLLTSESTSGKPIQNQFAATLRIIVASSCEQGWAVERQEPEGVQLRRWQIPVSSTAG
jgi:hypothetical protein